MKLKSEIIKDQKGIILSWREYIYNDIGKLVRQDYKDKNGKRNFYKTFEYDENGNCIRTFEYSDTNELQVSFEYTYDKNNDQIKAIERTAEGNIWDWTEIENEPKKNLKIWLSKDENGNIIHKTVEYILEGYEQRFNSENRLYEIYLKKFDKENRLVEEVKTDQLGNEKEKHIYEYQGKKKIWKLILNGSIVKTEETVYDNKDNITFYIRKKSNGKCMEWFRFEYDKYGNKEKYYWGKEEGKQLGFQTYEYIYERNSLNKGST